MKVSMLFTVVGLVASAAAKDLELCKQPGFVNCVPLSSAFVCDNVIAGKTNSPFKISFHVS